jgi:hypothetical protein
MRIGSIGHNTAAEVEADMTRITSARRWIEWSSSCRYRRSNTSRLISYKKLWAIQARYSAGDRQSTREQNVRYMCLTLIKSSEKSYPLSINKSINDPYCYKLAERLLWRSWEYRIINWLTRSSTGLSESVWGYKDKEQSVSLIGRQPIFFYQSWIRCGQ